MKLNHPTVTLLAITPQAEKLIEEAGRTCYLSLDRITDGSEKNFVRGCIRSGHLSIIEHASATFRIRGASRAFTHQLVRHRVASFSQQSQRYVGETEFNYIIPPEIETNNEARAVFDECIERTRTAYARLRELGVKKEDARFVLPNALESEIVFTANFREFRHIFQLRLHKSAQWEIRRACFDMLKILQREAPTVFGDFVPYEADHTAKSEYID